MLTAELELHGAPPLLVHCRVSRRVRYEAVMRQSTYRCITLYRYRDALGMDKFPCDMRNRSVDTLAFAGTGDAQTFAIFGDGTAGNLDTFAMEFLGNSLVG